MQGSDKKPKAGAGVQDECHISRLAQALISLLGSLGKRLCGRDEAVGIL